MVRACFLVCSCLFLFLSFALRVAVTDPGERRWVDAGVDACAEAVVVMLQYAALPVYLTWTDGWMTLQGFPSSYHHRLMPCVEDVYCFPPRIHLSQSVVRGSVFLHSPSLSHPIPSYSRELGSACIVHITKFPLSPYLYCRCSPTHHAVPTCPIPRHYCCWCCC